MKKISVLTFCYNEELNVEELYLRIKKQFSIVKDNYKYEHIYIDNASTDSTVKILKKIAEKDMNVKIIINTKNFGHIRSPFYGLQQAYGDAVIFMTSDLQDPPEMIPQMLEKWEEEYQIVIGIKEKSTENPIMFLLRKTFYRLIKACSDIEHISDFTGFGLYDKSFVDILRQINDPYPYLRGLVAEFGTNIFSIKYTQPKRKRGKSKNNFYTLYDIAMLGFVNYSKIPLRLATFIGFGVALISILVALGYFAYKLFYWDTFQAGSAPLVIGLFFFSAVQLFFLGIIGEYVGSIFTEVRKRPLVIEKERVNF